MTNREIVKYYSEIPKLSEICSRNNILYNNVYAGTTSEENFEIIAKECLKEIYNAFCGLIAEGLKNHGETNTL